MRYIEIIVLLNVLIHLILVIASSYVSEIKGSKLFILLSVILDAIYIILYVYIPYELEKYKYLMIIIISILPFISRQFTKTLVGMLIYLLLNLCFGGLANVLYTIINSPYVVIGGIILVYLVVIITTLIIRKSKKNKELFYDILLEYDGKILPVKGYYDTGNMVIVDEVIPVVFLNKKYKIGRYYKNINITTVNHNSGIDIYIIDSFRIKVDDKYVKKRVYIAYADIRYDAIFGHKILGG